MLIALSLRQNTKDSQKQSKSNEKKQQQKMKQRERNVVWKLDRINQHLAARKFHRSYKEKKKQ